MFVCADDGSHGDTAARALVTGADTRVEEMIRIGESTTVRGDREAHNARLPWADDGAEVTTGELMRTGERPMV
jgi:hypothetical protein